MRRFFFKEEVSLFLSREGNMFHTLGLICMILWYLMLFHPLHADIQCMELDEQESPITNVNVDWRKMELSWESSRNFSEYKCIIMDRDMEYIETEVDSPLCSFPAELHMPLHKGVTFTIEVPNTNISKQCNFVPGGMNGTAIENFACVIFNVSFMNCTWHVGRTATEDTQYFLYWRPRKKEDVTECQNYIKDTCGRHIGCRFQNVTIENSNAYFLVNGSRSGQSIQSYEKKILLYKIEKLTPPLNVTVNCTEASHRCSISWQPPHTSHVKRSSCFKYEIVIENKANAKKNTKTASKTAAIIESNSYLYESFISEKRYSIKIRAKDVGFCLVSPNWGEWSTPVEFGTQQPTSTSSYMLLLIPGLAAVLTFFLCVTVRAYLKKTSDIVPRPRDPFHEPSPMNFQTEYMNLLKQEETEEIANIEEVMECK